MQRLCGQISAKAFGQRDGLLQHGVGHQHGEFLAPQAQQDIAVAAEHLAHAFGEGLQAEVAGAVAVLVVDRLEVIDIQQHQGQLAVLPACVGQPGG
ncbi:hypothetical protein D3C86_1812440 [compost metagenome]